MNSTTERKLRANSTAPERRMWRLLYPFRTDGYHFRKQEQIGPYYVDFACHHAKVVVEVDGDTHGTEDAIAHDRARDAFLGREGYTVLRFFNDDLMHHEDGVFTIISTALDGRPRSPRSLPSKDQ